MTSSKPSASFRAAADRCLTVVLVGAAAIAGGLVLWIVLFIARESMPALLSIAPWRFATDASWHPQDGLFKITPMVAATLAISLVAMCLAAPLGIATAMFSSFFAPARIAGLLRRWIEILAGIPSVVYGLWGLTVLVPRIAAIQAPGLGLLAASLVLALMILPTVALTAEAALRSVDEDLLRGAAALGLDRTGTALHVALPAAKNGIFAGLVLATARALGETMAVLMVAGNVVQMPGSLFDSIRPLTANIALEMGYATADHRSVLFASGLALMLMVGLLVALSTMSSPEATDG